jgi:hypothetical protein
MTPDGVSKPQLLDALNKCQCFVFVTLSQVTSLLNFLYVFLVEGLFAREIISEGIEGWRQLANDAVTGCVNDDGVRLLQLVVPTSTSFAVPVLDLIRHQTMASSFSSPPRASRRTILKIGGFEQTRPITSDGSQRY